MVFLSYLLGNYYDESGIVYIGDFYYDVQHGHGKEVYPNGKYYEGDFDYGLKTGFGEFFWTNGDIYSGEFIDNKICGKGTKKIFFNKRKIFLTKNIFLKKKLIFLRYLQMERRSSLHRRF